MVSWETGLHGPCDHLTVLSDNLCDGASTDAPGAHVSALHFTVFLEPDFLQVGQPPVAGQVMSVAHTIPILGALITNRTFPAHGVFLPKLNSKERQFNIPTPFQQEI